MSLFVAEVDLRVNSVIGNDGVTGIYVGMALAYDPDYEETSFAFAESFDFCFIAGSHHHLNVNLSTYIQDWSEDTWYTLRIEVEEDDPLTQYTTRLYIDNDLKRTTTDASSVPIGTIRVELYGEVPVTLLGEWSLDAEFDNFSLTLDGTALLTDDFADGDPDGWEDSGTLAYSEDGSWHLNDAGEGMAESALYRYTWTIDRGGNHHLYRDWHTNRLFKVYAA